MRRIHSPFFLFTITILFTLLSPLYVVGVDPSYRYEQFHLVGENLKITFPEVDTGIHSEVSASPALVNFEPLSQEQRGDNFLFIGNAYIQFYANFFTDYTADQVWNQEDRVKHEISTLWADVLYTGCWTCCVVENFYKTFLAIPTLGASLTIPDCMHRLLLTGKYYEYKVGDQYGIFPVSTGGEIGDTPVRMEIVSPQLETLDFGAFTMEPVSLYHEILSSSVLQSNYQQIGEYSDIFVGDNEAGLTFSTDVPSMNDAVDDWNSQISVYGIKRSSPVQTMVGEAQQGAVLTPTVGSDFYNYGYGPRLKIVPRVDLYHELLTIRKVQARADTSQAALSPAFVETYSVGDETKYRIVGWHIQNYNVQVKVETKIQIIVGVKVTPTEGTLADLDVPNLFLSDKFWNVYIEGDTSGTVEFTKNPLDLFFENIFTILIVVAIIGISIFVIIKVVKTRNEKKKR